MKVNPPILTPLSGVVNNPGAQTSARASVRTGHSAGKGAVAISATAQQLAGLQQGEYDVDMVRVNEIRAALAAGTLRIDTNRIADALVQSVCELLDKEQS